MIKGKSTQIWKGGCLGEMCFVTTRLIQKVTICFSVLFLSSAFVNYNMCTSGGCQSDTMVSTFIFLLNSRCCREAETERRTTSDTCSPFTSGHVLRKGKAHSATVKGASPSWSSPPTSGCWSSALRKEMEKKTNHPGVRFRKRTSELSTISKVNKVICH